MTLLIRYTRELSHNMQHRLTYRHWAAFVGDLLRLGRRESSKLYFGYAGTLKDYLEYAVSGAGSRPRTVQDVRVLINHWTDLWIGLSSGGDTVDEKYIQKRSEWISRWAQTLDSWERP